jgi:tRNA A37 methylthiotransferase MiaB
LEWIRLSYLQPAEIRPSLIESICTHEHVVPYFDLSFQHASGPLLRRMRRFGDADSFRGLIERIRNLAPHAGIRSNVIVGFPGETEEDVAILDQFLADAGLDAIGVFGYSDEDGTEAATLSGHLGDDEITERVSQVAALADELCAQRAAARVGERMPVLVEAVDGAVAVGRGPHQGPEVDGTVRFAVAGAPVRRGDLVPVEVSDSDGVDLIATRRRSA